PWTASAWKSLSRAPGGSSPCASLPEASTSIVIPREPSWVFPADSRSSCRFDRDAPVTTPFGHHLPPSGRGRHECRRPGSHRGCIRRTPRCDGRRAGDDPSIPVRRPAAQRRGEAAGASPHARGSRRGDPFVSTLRELLPPARSAPLPRGGGVVRFGRSDVAVLVRREDRKSTRLNSSHDQISYAVFCLKK